MPTSFSASSRSVRPSVYIALSFTCLTFTSLLKLHWADIYILHINGNIILTYIFIVQDCLSLKSCPFFWKLLVLLPLLSVLEAFERLASVPIQSQINLVHTTQSYLSMAHFNIMHLPISWSSKWPSFCLLINVLHEFLSAHSCDMPCSSHPPRLDHSNYTWRRPEVMKLLIMQFSSTSSYFFSLRSKYSPQHTVL
jgi:hypothetical protein